MKKHSIVLNGQFFIQKTTGQQRYAREILNELDKIIEKDSLKIIVPKKAVAPNYENLKIIRFGFLHNRLWEQICLPLYLLFHNCRAFSFCNTTPLLMPGPSVIHDICIKEHPEFFTTFKGKVARLYYLLNLRRVVKSKYPIITVTEFSKQRICEVCKVKKERIFVMPNAWQHFLRIKENENYFLEHPEIKKGSYYFALGSRAAQKNFKWIYENAKLFPNNLYLIAGQTVANFSDNEKELDNLKYLGFVSDEDVKALMKHCKAFLFPSIFEGFGIPPLEALSVGAKVVASNTSCIPEVLGKSVYYIDPKNPNISLDEIIKWKTEETNDSTLQKYSWGGAATLLKSFLSYPGFSQYQP